MRVLPRVEAGIPRYIAPLLLDRFCWLTNRRFRFLVAKVLGPDLPADISTMNLRARNI